MTNKTNKQTSHRVLQIFDNLSLTSGRKALSRESNGQHPQRIGHSYAESKSVQQTKGAEGAIDRGDSSTPLRALHYLEQRSIVAVTIYDIAIRTLEIRSNGESREPSLEINRVYRDLSQPVKVRL